MGKPTGATVVHPDGREQAFTDVKEAVAVAGPGQVELLYDYHAALLPPPGPQAAGMWRYRELLPLEDGPITYPLLVGGTPLIAPPRLRERLGLPHLWLKDETRGPSGSNKDRATALVLQHAMAAGGTRVTCASTGNVAASLAIGAAAAGREAVVFVPASVAEAKLRLMLQAGATVVKVAEGYEAAFQLSRQAARAFGWVDRNTGANPATVEAKKTVALEVWEQLQRSVPDVVVVPVGDGPTLHAAVKGFRELVACGATRRLPRVLGVQAAGCQPVKRAWERGGPVEPVANPATIADGIAVGAPVSGAMALRCVALTGGAFVAVSDGEMLAAVQLLARYAGVLAEPAGAAALAGLLAAVEQGLVGRDERVVALVTGSGLKTPQHLRPEGRVLQLDGADLERLQALVGPGIPPAQELLDDGV